MHVMRRYRAVGLIIVLLSLAAACGSPSSRSPDGASGAPAPASGPKRILAAIRGDPPSFARERTNPSGTVSSVPGLDALQELVHVGLIHADDRGAMHPVLAEAVPSVNNG